MKNDIARPHIFNSITELHRALGLPKPLHPLISLVNYADITTDTTEISKGMVFNFYKVSYKKNFTGKFKYGQSYYDFDEGGLSFVSPNQLITAHEDEADYDGYTLLFHPDFISAFPLAKKIKDKLRNGIPSIGSLLSYSKRFYNRQFITRKVANNGVLIRTEAILDDYFNSDKGLMNGLPSVQQIAGQLNVTPHYLSDMLRSLTGQNTQQHIHNRLIGKAKELLSTGNLSISEVAYQLGFEHPQSFNKLFKRKTKVSPLEFRQSFN